MKKKKKQNRQRILIIAIGVIILVSILSVTLNEDKKASSFSSLVKDSVLNISKVVLYPFRFVINKVEDYNNLADIREKYQELLSSTDRISSLEAENIELRKQIDALKDELNITYTINDYEFLNATVISRNIAYWYNTITIDKGSFNGIKKDMVVVNSQGLIGKIVSVSTFTSDVRLLTTGDTANKISVRITDGITSVNGLISGYDYGTNTLTAEGISNTERVNAGDYVYTSGLGGIYPSGILIGFVREINTDEYDLAKIINVEPVCDFNDINYVAVLKRKENNDD
jgi:rod shape-determining protein MreC